MMNRQRQRSRIIRMKLLQDEKETESEIIPLLRLTAKESG